MDTSLGGVQCLVAAGGRPAKATQETPDQATRTERGCLLHHGSHGVHRAHGAYVKHEVVVEWVGGLAGWRRVLGQSRGVLRGEGGWGLML